MTTVLGESDVRPQAQPAAGGRYNGITQALHWITAALVFITLAVAWVMYNMADNAPMRGVLFTLHKSLGITIFALVIARLVWRARHAAPPLSRSLSRWVRASAIGSHGLLYFVLIFMPLTGYMMSASGAHPISFFGLIDLPTASTKHESGQHIAFLAHVGVLQWVLYALLLLHIGAAIWHASVRRDGTLDRMLPPQREGEDRPL